MEGRGHRVETPSFPWRLGVLIANGQMVVYVVSLFSFPTHILLLLLLQTNHIDSRACIPRITPKNEIPVESIIDKRSET